MEITHSTLGHVDRGSIQAGEPFQPNDSQTTVHMKSPDRLETSRG
jgi:hypothetical protein